MDDHAIAFLKRPRWPLRKTSVNGHSEKDGKLSYLSLCEDDILCWHSFQAVWATICMWCSQSATCVVCSRSPWHSEGPSGTPAKGPCHPVGANRLGHISVMSRDHWCANPPSPHKLKQLLLCGTFSAASMSYHYAAICFAMCQQETFT